MNATMGATTLPESGIRFEADWAHDHNSYGAADRVLLWQGREIRTEAASTGGGNFLGRLLALCHFAFAIDLTT